MIETAHFSHCINTQPSYHLPTMCDMYISTHFIILILQIDHIRPDKVPKGQTVAGTITPTRTLAKGTDVEYRDGVNDNACGT
jgi:hypothetical protein